jgi:DNA-3-methyladenine glycosylase II
MKIKGIGRWTSDIYLLMALLRPDVWPRGDLALASAVQQIKRLKHRPTEEELGDLSNAWKPWRSVAARLLWNHYLKNRPGKETSAASRRNGRRSPGLLRSAPLKPKSD